MQDLARRLDLGHSGARKRNHSDTLTRWYRLLADDTYDRSDANAPTTGSEGSSMHLGVPDDTPESRHTGHVTIGVTGSRSIPLGAACAPCTARAIVDTRTLLHVDSTLDSLQMMHSLVVVTNTSDRIVVRDWEAR